MPAPSEGVAEGEVQVSMVHSQEMIPELLTGRPARIAGNLDDFGEEQRKDSNLRGLFSYLVDGVLPREEAAARKVVAKALQLTVHNGNPLPPGYEAKRLTAHCCT